MFIISGPPALHMVKIVREFSLGDRGTGRSSAPPRLSEGALVEAESQSLPIDTGHNLSNYPAGKQKSK